MRCLVFGSIMFLLGILHGTSAIASLINKDKALAAQTFWDNKDWDWYKANIPFFDAPDSDLVTTYYYRWELLTKHLTYGSPASGYSFTEFIDRPFWSGAYGAIACPAGHQLYEARWLRNPRYAKDYAQYWFRTQGAQPRRYGTWIADGLWAVQHVHPDTLFATSLLRDLKNNYEGWEKRQFVKEMGLFWQNGHDDGMEYNITSRQTEDPNRGGDGFRPGFNAYMYADALAIAHIARLAGDIRTATAYEAKAAGLKERVQKHLWDSKRNFFFPMALRDEKDGEGNVVKKHSLTYQTGKFAGSPHGREEHGYIPWQFNLPDPGYEAAWQFLMDKDYFLSDFGPTTVERHDPLFSLQKKCCWWSGQSWPFATAQTLKAMANLLQHYKQQYVSRTDYTALLSLYARSHRKASLPYLAEALHPDTGSFEGHDSYNHSEHYFHSSFNDLVITGLIGLQSGNTDTVLIEPLAPEEWPYFAIDDLPYRGHLLGIAWDKDGSRYGHGPGLHIFLDGKRFAGQAALGKLEITLPKIARSNALMATSKKANSKNSHSANFASNNDGDYYPRASASYSNPKTPLYKINDGNYWYTQHPPNRWTTVGSPNDSDWIILDFGTRRKINQMKLYFLDDSADVLAPASYDLSFWNGKNWQTIPSQARIPNSPTGHRANIVAFPEIVTRRIRATFTHAPSGRTGLTEIETWGPMDKSYRVALAPKGNIAHNPSEKGFPKISASLAEDPYGSKPAYAIDGIINHNGAPLNRWTAVGSQNTEDWLELDFGKPMAVGRVELYLYDDNRRVLPPASYLLQAFIDREWRNIERQIRTPEQPTGGTVNEIAFPEVTTPKIRIVFTHAERGKSGVTEISVWRK